MRKPFEGKIAGLKYIIAIIPVVLIITLILFTTVRNEIMKLSEERLSLIANNYSYDISNWAEKALSELDIYRDIAVKEDAMNEHTFELIRSSRFIDDAYPYGIYWGDINGRYFDSSGWQPKDGFVPSQRSWYAEGLKHSDFAFGESYIDAHTGNTCVSATVKLNCGGIESVMAADVYLDYLSDMLDNIVSGEIDSAFVAERKNRLIIASTDRQQTGKKFSDENSQLFRSIDELIAADFTGQTCIRGDYVCISKIDHTDWIMVICMKRNTLLSELHSAESVMHTFNAAAAIWLIVFTLLSSKKMNDTFRRAKTDPLTSLLNRSSFRTLSMKALQETPEHGVMLIFDMDNFKQVNDRLGHPAGDEVLKRFAELLNGFFNRSSDITSRLGGDEFAVFAGRKLNRDEVSAMLKRFISLFHEAFDGDYGECSLSVSIGAAFAEECGGVYGELYKKADSALYKAKNDGKDGFSLS